MRRAAWLADMEADPGDARHGTERGYIYGCRCDACTRASAEARQAREAGAMASAGEAAAGLLAREAAPAVEANAARRGLLSTWEMAGGDDALWRRAMAEIARIPPARTY